MRLTIDAMGRLETEFGPDWLEELLQAARGASPRLDVLRAFLTVATGNDAAADRFGTLEAVMTAASDAIAGAFPKKEPGASPTPDAARSETAQPLLDVLYGIGAELGLLPRDVGDMTPAELLALREAQADAEYDAVKIAATLQAYAFHQPAELPKVLHSDREKPPADAAAEMTPVQWAAVFSHIAGRPIAVDRTA